MITDNSESIALPSRYRVERQLGAGAAGEVYLATDLEQQQKVVIKALKKHAVSDPKKVARFHNEFNALKNCQHPNIIRVFDFSEFNGLHFYTMEYLEGQTLDELIYAPSPSYNTISHEDKIKIFFQIAHALSFVHDKGLIHRDLKPANVFITSTGTVKLLDFGIARLEEANFNLTSDSEMLGTPYYMSPEQLAKQSEDEKLDCRTDIYSLGVLCFELFTATRPFKAESHFDLIIEHRAGVIPSARELNPNVPNWLDSLITTCLQKDRTRRYNSALEILAIIKANCDEIVIESTLAKRLSNLNDKVLNKHQQNKRSDNLKSVSLSTKRVGLAFVLSVVFMFLFYTPLGPLSNIYLLRTFFSLRGPITPPENVVLVAVDDLSFQKLGASTLQSFPRKHLAAALKKIQQTKPKFVIMDFFIQPDDRDPEANQELAKAISMGPTSLMSGEIENESLPKEKRNKENAIKYHNDKLFSDAATLEISPAVRTNLGITAYISLDDNKAEPNQRMPIRAALSAANLAGLSAPSTRDLINFYGKPNAIPYHSIYEILLEPDSDQAPLDFHDKIVVIGYKSLAKTDVPGAHDVQSASGSFFEDYFGAEVQATIAANLIDGNYLKTLPQRTEQTLLAVFVAFIFFFLLTNRPSRGLLVLSVVLLFWFLVSYWLFLSKQLFFPGVNLMALVSIFVLAVGWFFYANATDADLKEAENLTHLKLRKRA
jgi:serine/threonine protein kinase